MMLWIVSRTLSTKAFNTIMKHIFKQLTFLYTLYNNVLPVINMFERK